MTAGSTYTPIATNTTSGTSTSTITFSSISGTYTDLVLVISAKAATVGMDLGIQLNGDTTTTYSSTFLTGNGTSAGSYKDTNANKLTLEYNASVRTGEYSVHIVNFQNYSNTTTYKTVINRANSTTGTDGVVGLWRNTSAINSMSIATYGGSNYAAGSTFTLYGITAA
jgi:hypothetical protein